MALTDPITSLGSLTAPDGTNRSGYFFNASCEVSSATPIRPFSMPKRSISCSVNATGSLDGRFFGTPLNM